MTTTMTTLIITIKSTIKGQFSPWSQQWWQSKQQETNVTMCIMMLVPVVIVRAILPHTEGESLSIDLLVESQRPGSSCIWDIRWPCPAHRAEVHHDVISKVDTDWTKCVPIWLCIDMQVVNRQSPFGNNAFTHSFTEVFFLQIIRYKKLVNSFQIPPAELVQVNTSWTSEDLRLMFTKCQLLFPPLESSYLEVFFSLFATDKTCWRIGMEIICMVVSFFDLPSKNDIWHKWDLEVEFIAGTFDLNTIWRLNMSEVKF